MLIIIFNDKDDVYVPSSEYSEDSSDEEFINERIKQLGDFTLIWSNNSNNKRRKSYTRNSIVTKYQRYDPSGKKSKEEIEQEFEGIRENENNDESETESNDENENENKTEINDNKSNDEGKDESDDKNDDESKNESEDESGDENEDESDNESNEDDGKSDNENDSKSDEDIIEQSLLFIRENNNKIIPKEMQEFEKLMPTFEGENMEQKNPLLLDHEKLHILVTHDECLFYSNDDRPIIWRKKEQEKSIMVSNFLLETIGRLKLTEQDFLLNPNTPSEAKKYLNPGKNEEDCTNYGAMAKDALNVMNMNVNPGRKQALMRLTFFGSNKTFQSIVFPPDHLTYPNKSKDFKAQKSQLQEEIEKKGHKCLQKIVPKALDSVPLITIRKYAQKS
ncbi:hypothetical protein C1645_811023 [Glomus cerebriforme]|uniref:Uncharacterized protein n=1 Tax=Glomus cerebriforme TaxID=658196 RepID=A0A397TP00_9GLOM|nr:hypothetical protein C1645_811023 [Glomus cerebriforme]